MKTFNKTIKLSLYVSLPLIAFSVFADNNHHHSLTQPAQTFQTYETIVYQVDSQAIAFAQAGANNHISAGTFKPQLSLGIGSYDSDFAASLMVGQKACKDCLLFSGSFAFDENFEETAFGFGATVTFK